MISPILIIPISGAHDDIFDYLYHEDGIALWIWLTIRILLKIYCWFVFSLLSCSLITLVYVVHFNKFVTYASKIWPYKF